MSSQKIQNSIAVGITLTILLGSFPLNVQAATVIPEIKKIVNRASLKGNDRLDWSSLGPTIPFNFLPNSFPATSQKGLELNVAIPPQPLPGLTPPFVFQTSRRLKTNFANGDFILFTGLVPVPQPAIGNLGPITITFAQPVFGAGTQIAADDTTAPFQVFISAFDSDNNLLDTVQATGTSSLALDNSARFLGVRSDIPNISQIVISTSVANRAFGINTLSIVTVSVPEPAANLGILLLGFLGIKVRGKQGKSKK